MKFISSDSPTISAYRQQLYQQLTAPIDGMWEQLYIANANVFLIRQHDQTLGYCCIDENKCLNQLFLLEKFIALMDKVVGALIDQEMIVMAHLSSNTPVAFNACLFHAKSVQTNTFCFLHPNQPMETDFSMALSPVWEDEIPAIKVFFKEQVGMDDNFGYTQNLVDRKEIYRIMEGGSIIATSECRLSDTQPTYADLGMIVHHQHRGKGIATQILKTQVNRVLAMGRKPICSTTYDNIASRRAIEKAGFYCAHIIFDINFKA